MSRARGRHTGAAPVFVDPRRTRRVRQVMVAAAIGALAFVAVAVLGLRGSGPLAGSLVLGPIRSGLDEIGRAAAGEPSTQAASATAAPTTASTSAAASPASVPRATASAAAGAASAAAAPSSKPTSAAPRPTTTPSATRAPSPAPTTAIPVAPSPSPTRTRPTQAAVPTPPGQSNRPSPTRGPKA